MRRLMWWTGILCFTVLLLLIITPLILYIPPIQDAAKRWGTAWLSQKTEMEIHVGSIRLQFPLRITVRDVQVGELLSVEEFDTDIRFRPLIQSTIHADVVNARGIVFQSDTTMQTTVLAQQLQADDIVYQWSERKLRIQNILLAGGDITIHGNNSPVSKDTATFRLPLTVTIPHTQLQSITVGYTNEQMKLNSTADNITLLNIAADTAMQVSLAHIELQNGTFTLAQKGKEPWALYAVDTQAESLLYSPTSITGRLTRLSFKESHGLSLHEGTMAVAWQEGMLALPHFAFRTEHSSLSGHLRTLGNNNGSIHIDCDADITVGHADAMLLTEWTDKIPKEFSRLYPTDTLSASIALDGPIEQLQLTHCTLSLPTAFDIKMSGMVQGITTPRQCKARCHVEARTYNLDFLTALTDSTLRKSIAIPHDITCQSDLFYAPDTLHAQCTLGINGGTAAIEAGYHPISGAYMLQVQTDSLDLHQIMPAGEFGVVNLRAEIVGNGLDYMEDNVAIHGSLQLQTLQWTEYTFSNASIQASLADKQLSARATYSDSLMQWELTTALKFTPGTADVQLHARLDNLNMKALQIANTNIHPALQCYTTLRIDSATTYTLRSHFNDIVLRTSTQIMRPKSLYLNTTLTPDTILLGIRSGDLTLKAGAHTEGLPWQWEQPVSLSLHTLSNYLSALQATLSIGNDNPVSNYLALTGIKFSTIDATISELQGNLTSHIAIGHIAAKGVETDSLSLTAHYTERGLHANLHSEKITWSTPQMQFQGKASATLVWSGMFNPDSISGMLHLSAVQYTMPTYNLQLHTSDTLFIPLEHGGLTLTALPLYSTGKQPLLIDGRIKLLGTPSLQLRLTARETNLIRTEATRETLLYGKALASGSVTLDGPFNALSIKGSLRLRPGSSIHYIYKDAILTANNQLGNVVTFANFNAGTTTTTLPQKRLSNSRLAININLAIDPTVQLEVSLGANRQNTITLQGGGTLNLQHIPATGLRLSGKYTIESGELNMNIPLLHASHMTIRSGSMVTWSGNPKNPQLNIIAEERIRASVTLDGSPQSILFVTGLTLSDTMEKLGLQFTLSAPENASMQNTLASLSSEERSKLAIALLTTGLYLGEGGTGNLMNTALMSILQSQLDNISRDAFRTIDVSVGIEPLLDGVSGISTRTDYSFSLAKRFWNDRIRIIIGGSVTTTGERIEDDTIIDNISIEWRINPSGNQYLRFFYDKNYESILEGEIRETGVGYAYRRKF